MLRAAHIVLLREVRELDRTAVLVARRSRQHHHLPGVEVQHVIELLAVRTLARRMRQHVLVDFAGIADDDHERLAVALGTDIELADVLGDHLVVDTDLLRQQFGQFLGGRACRRIEDGLRLFLVVQVCDDAGSKRGLIAQCTDDEPSDGRVFQFHLVNLLFLICGPPPKRGFRPGTNRLLPLWRGVNRPRL